MLNKTILKKLSRQDAKAQGKKLLMSPNLACFAPLRETSFFRSDISKPTQISNMLG
jgi:hypothetical protein